MACPILSPLVGNENRIEEEVQITSNNEQKRNWSVSAGIPFRFLEATFDNTKNGATEKLKDFALNGKGVLILNGNNGTGKSRSACASINYRIESNIASGMYISCMYQVCPLIRSSRSFKADKNELQVMNDYYTTPFLVIDEVGKGDDLVISKMFTASVLAARYDNCLPTVIVSNLEMEELCNFVGMDIKSRFKETATVLALTGKDWRNN